jgi:signal transduction histidine kinase/ActR/RegA family two-component response regulator
MPKDLKNYPQEDSSNPVEELIFKLVNTWAVAITFGYFFVTLYFKYHWLVKINIFILFITYSCLWFYHHIKQQFKELYLPFIGITLYVLSFNWFYLGGYYGETPIYFFLSALVFVMILEDKKQGYYISFVSSVILLILCLLQYHRPQLIVRFSDMHYSQSIAINCIVCMLGIFGLMTRLRFRLNENKIQLQKRNDELKKATEAKTNFLANMSHEIRTPMNGLIGMTSILSNTTLNSEQKDYVDTIRISGEKLLDIVNEILDFSKIEAGEIVMENSPFSLKKCLEEVIDISAPKAAKKHIELLLDTEAADLSIFVQGDPGKLRQVLLNLVDNAIKFTQKGQVKLEIKATLKTNDRTEITFAIHDTGMGIAEENKHKLFKKFSQLDTSHTRKHGGSGLGLVIVKELVRLMGGTVSYSSVLHQGSVFYFTLSYLIISDLKMNRYGLQKSKQVEKEIDLSLPQLEILIAEDDRINQKLAQRLFSKLGFVPDIAFNGLQALEYANQKKYAIIFMDLQMPVMDGFDATLKILETAQYPKPLIIALTANVMEEDKERCFEIGMVDFLAKPITIQSVKSILKQWEPTILKQLSQS